MLFHAYSAYGSVEPSETETLLSKIFAYGWLGVNLFFSISGYVIYMSLLKSKNFFTFGFARYLRLAPAMLLASILIYVSSFYIVERPLGPAKLVDILPSLTFIGPGLLSRIFDIEIKSLDGAFWSLYVEVKFYILVSILYFFLNDKKLHGLSVMFVSWIVLSAISEILKPDYLIIEQVLKILDYCETGYFGWFLIGVFAYKYHTKKKPLNLLLLLITSVLAILSIEYDNIGVLLIGPIVVVVFILPIFSRLFNKWLTFRFFIFFGYISYPLYLIHQNIVTGLAIKSYNFFPYFPSLLYPIPFIGVVILIALFITRIEPYIKNKLIRILPKKLFGIQIIFKSSSN